MPTESNTSTHTMAPSPAALASAAAQVDVALSSLHFSRLRFDLVLQEPLHLPQFYGSTLRGGLGVFFKRLVCVQPQMERCRDCALLHQCAYPYVFETPLPPGQPSAPHLQEVSPYVLEPVTPAGSLSEGTQVSFRLLLFGRAITHLPYFIISYRQLGQEGGLSRERARFALARVVDETPGFIPQTLYERESGSVNVQPNRSSLLDYLPPLPRATERVYVDFHSPARIKSQNKITNEPNFREVCAALLRRLSQLVIVHGDSAGGTGWDVDTATLLAAAAEVEAVHGTLDVQKWDRYSGRQAQSIRMGGVVGTLELQGNLRPFLPLLWAGQYLHIGRGTTFGNGHYSVRL